LDAFVLMPNHTHGIVIIVDADATNRRGTTCRAPTDAGLGQGGSQGAGAGGDRASTDTAGSTSQRFGLPTAQSLSTIVRSFKAAVTKRVRELAGRPDLEVWQRNYYEHVIRNEGSLNEIRRYIQENPLRWALDRENPANIRGNRVQR
jgi:hypothetical protein